MSQGSVVEWSEILGLGMGVCLRGLVLLFLVLVHVLIYKIFVGLERIPRTFTWSYR